MATIKSEYYRFNGVSWDIHYFKTTMDMVDGLNTALAGKLDVSSANYIKHNEVLMPNNPFGGRKLYINHTDNAMYSANKKWVVVATRHLKSYGGQTYPMLNPDYVGEYTITGSGTTRTISNTPKPSNIVVYENDVLKFLTTHYTYNSSTGVITFTYTPSGTIYVYGGAEIPQYLDSPVDYTYTDGQVANLFDGSYETNISATNENYYIKIKITPGSGNYYEFDFSYKYGNFYLSYYYLGTPEKAEYRVYNYSYRPHGIGWKKIDFTDYIGNNTVASHVQTVYDGGNHGRSIMEFIIYGKPLSSGYPTSPTQIDWRLDRPDLNKTGATVTKFGVNKLYNDLKFGDRTTDKVVISPAGTIKINNLDIYHPGNKPTITDLGALVETNQKLLFGGSTQYIRLAYAGNTQAFIKHGADATEEELWHSGNFNPSDYMPKSGGTFTGAVAFTGLTSFDTLDINTMYVDTISSDGGSISFGGVDNINFGYIDLVGIRGLYSETDSFQLSDENIPTLRCGPTGAGTFEVYGSIWTDGDITSKSRKVITEGPTAAKTANYTFVLGDANGFIYSNSASALTFTIPLNSSVAYPTGTEIHIMRYGTGEISISPTSGVTLVSEGSKRRINAQYQAASLKKLDTNTWVLIGALKT